MPDEICYGQIDGTYAKRLASTPAAEDGPVWMVNLMHYRDVADYGDAECAAGDTAGSSPISGREADERYTPTESLTAIGAEIVFVADVDQQLLGDAPHWDRVAVVKYPTRRSFIDMQRRPDFQRQHTHKDAGMAATIVMGGQPMPTPEPPSGQTVPEWSHVPHPPTPEDGPVVVLHVLRYHDAAAAAETPEHMVTYQTEAGRVALRHGVRVPAWFAIEGTIVGDGREWHQARFNAFPSKEAFLKVVFDPARLAAQHEHREVAIADTYTMILRPTIDRLEASLGSAVTSG